MVKNTGGGKGAKRQASKHSSNPKAEELRKSESPNEVYACITQNFGNRYDVITLDGDTLSCRMGGKFKGRKKRDNIATTGCWVLVGLYEWEKEVKNCELLCIYDKHNVDELRSLPGFNWKHLNAASKGAFDSDDDEEEDGFEFTDLANEISPTSATLFEPATASGTSIQNDEEVNFEDL
jgi:hypothetical protein